MMETIIIRWPQLCPSHTTTEQRKRRKICVHVLNQLLDKNKIASVTPTPKRGEVAELKSMLKF